MEISELFWQASLDELKQGYIHEGESFTCLLCGERFEDGIIYPHEGIFYSAKRYMHIHIENTHVSVFDYLISLNKKLTGLTDHQNSLLRLFYQGKGDSEVQQELGIGSASTIRNHRFVLKEKERQAKTFLAMMELLREKDLHAPTFLEPHKTATMVDERYNITEEEQEDILQKHFNNRKLKTFHLKEKQKLVVLREIVKSFERDRIYEEQEMNQILTSFYDDYVLLRRYLIEYGFIDRKADGSQYWLKK